jgi:hypothetical protein
MQLFQEHKPKRILEDMCDSSYIESYPIRFDFSSRTHHSIGVFQVELVVKLFHNLLDDRRTLGSNTHHLDPTEVL